MKQATRRTFHATHSWIGICAGILLFAVSFSGIPAMFAAELTFWQSPQLRGLEPVEEIRWQPLYEAALEQGFEHDDVVMIPDQQGGYSYFLQLGGGEDGGALTMTLKDFQPLEPGHSDVVHLLEHLHTDLHLPQPWGRYLVGFAGMAMLLSIIAGVVIHTRWWQEARQLRIRRSWRLLLSDHHKLMGLWVLPFAAVLAFTGTILGLLGLISPILALAKFEGDVAAATAAVLGPQAEIIGEPAEMASLDDLYAIALEKQPDLTINFVRVSGYGDAGAVVKFAGGADGKLTNLQSVTLSLVDGKVLHQADATQKGPFYRMFAAVTPLHYVLFGDVWLKLFYAVCTLALCAVVASGNMIWLEKKQRKGAHWLAGLTLGSCSGLVLATCVALGATPWLFGLGEQQPFWEEVLFWLVWGVATLAGVLLPATTQRRQLAAQLALAGLFLWLGILGDGIISGSWLWTASMPVMAGVQIVFAVTGAVMLLGAARLMGVSADAVPDRVQAVSVEG